MSSCFSVPVALALLAFAFPAFADEEISDTEIEAAFAFGLGDEFVGDATFEVKRFGRTLLLTGALTGRDDLSPLELTCMLCTPQEALQSAQSAGASLAEQSGLGGNPPLSEVPTSAEPEPRPLWIPTVLTGLGVAAVAAGTALLLLDGDCASTEVDADGDCRQVHDSAPVGWGVLSAGAISVVTGVVLFVLFAGDEQPAGDEP